MTDPQVIDHGIWRGRREWTVKFNGKAITVRDNRLLGREITTEAEAIAYARTIAEHDGRS